MNKIDMKKYDDLWHKINDRIDGANVRGEQGFTSALDLDYITKEAFAGYNAILNEKVSRDIKKLNKKISKARLFNKKVPYVSSLTPTIFEDGKEELSITFSYDNKCKGIAVIKRDLSIEFEFLRPKFSIEDTLEVLRKNYINFVAYFNALDSFSLEYPGISFEFGESSKDENNIQELHDGFISVKYDLSRPYRTRATLQNIEDLHTSRERNPKYGELYEYVEFYNTSILRSFKVNEEDLNPLFRQMLEKSKKVQKGQERVLRVK